MYIHIVDSLGGKGEKIKSRGKLLIDSKKEKKKETTV